jgi:hypothetical protein
MMHINLEVTFSYVKLVVLTPSIVFCETIMNNVFQVVVNVNLGAKPNPIPDAQIYELLAKAEASQLSFRPLQFSKPQGIYLFLSRL